MSNVASTVVICGLIAYHELLFTTEEYVYVYVFKCVEYDRCCEVFYSRKQVQELMVGPQNFRVRFSVWLGSILTIPTGFFP